MQSLLKLFCIAGFLALASAHAEEGFEIDFSEVPTVHFPAGDRIVAAYPAFEEYAYMLFDICDAFGFEVENECLVYPLNADLGGNALATVFDGNRVIVYDRQLSPLIGYEGAVMVIAHELAHHHCGHIETPLGPDGELQADAFAGAAARLTGITLDDAVEVAEFLDTRPSPGHPGRDARVEAIRAGWNEPEKGKACRLP